MSTTFKAVLWSLSLGIVWCLYVAWMHGGKHQACNFCWDGGCWGVLSLPATYSFLKETKHFLPSVCAVLCGLALAFPFFYTGLLVAYPEMTVPVVLGTVGFALMIGIYPVLIWIDSSDKKESV